MNSTVSTSSSAGPIHIVITRRVKPGYEAEFQHALREFFQSSFGHDGVLGASMLVPPPDSNSREFGILRTFATGHDRDAFYASPLFLTWQERVAPLTDDDWSYRQLSGMEAWFRGPQRPPARWKMAILTWLAVWPVSLGVRVLLLPVLGSTLPAWLFAGVAAAGIVATLTWVAMPFLVKLAQSWLQPPKHPTLSSAHQHGVVSADRD